MYYINIYSYKISDNFLASLITQKIFLKEALLSEGSRVEYWGERSADVGHG